MKTLVNLLIILATTVTYSVAAPSVIFLHHSTGRNLLAEGEVRNQVYSQNPDIAIWDHDYPYLGLYDRNGISTGRSWGSAMEYTDVDDWYNIWVLNYYPAFVDSCLSFDIVAFKSCFPNAHIDSDAKLSAYMAYYTDIVDRLQTYDNKFIVMGFPPLRESLTTPDEAARAREFTDWLATICTGNVYYFNLFDNFADSDNFLKDAYERDLISDSHPNEYGNQVVGTIFASFILDVASMSTGVHESEFNCSWSDIKSLYK